MTVHGPRPPACTSIAKPNIERKSSAERPPVHREVGEAHERADHAQRADQPGQADRRGVELEHDQREAGDDQEVRDRRADQAVQQRVAESEPVEHDVLVGLAPAVRAGADHLRGRELHRTGGGGDGLAVELHDDLADGRPDAVRGTDGARRGRAEPHAGELAGAVGVATVATRPARPGGRPRRRGCRRPGRRGAPGDRARRRSPATRRRGGRPRGGWWRRPWRRRPTGRPTPRSGTRDRSMARTTGLDVGVDRARRVQLEDRAACDRLSFASLDRVEHERRRSARRGSPRPGRRRCRAGRPAASLRPPPRRARATRARDRRATSNAMRAAHRGARWGLP